MKRLIFDMAYYGNLTFSDILSSIDPQTMFLVTVFLVSFALLYFSLNRVFKNNSAVAGVVAFSISLFITYGANRSGFDFEGVFYGLGVSSDLAFTIISIVSLVGAVYIGWKWGIGKLFMGLGTLFILIAIFAYEKAATVAIGVILFVIGLLFWLARGRRLRGP